MVGRSVRKKELIQEATATKWWQYEEDTNIMSSAYICGINLTDVKDV